MSRQPVLFLTHGGGPMPLLDDPTHTALTASLRELGSRLRAGTAAADMAGAPPQAVLVISAHWAAPGAAVELSTGAADGALLFDYSGFPPQAYAYDYRAPAAADLAPRVAGLLQGAGVGVARDGAPAQRGFDHGVFVPLMLMFPDADVPMLQLSMLDSLDAAAHLAIGRALAPLREEGVLIVASGSSFHNMGAFFGSAGADAARWSQEFGDWLAATCAAPAPEREAALARWESAAPFARECHPREEHLIPLMVAAGAAGADARPVQRRTDGDAVPQLSVWRVRQLA